MTRKLAMASVALAIASIFSAVPAAAQTVTGQVNVHGFVAPRCGATYNGDSTFSGTINLGELTQSNGTLSPALSSSSSSGPAGNATFLVGCSQASAEISVSATRLANLIAAGATSSNAVDYTAQVRIALAGGGFATVDYTTAAAAPSPTAQTIASFFANAAGNFDIRVFGFAADKGSSSILVAGGYDSVITIIVSPTV